MNLSTKKFNVSRLRYEKWDGILKDCPWRMYTLQADFLITTKAHNSVGGVKEAIPCW